MAKTKAKTLTIPESVIEDQILHFLNISGWYARKIPMAGYFDPKTRTWRKHKSKWVAIGFSDIIAIKNGRIIFLEVKSKIGKQSFDQKEFQRNIEFHDFEYYLVRSVEDARKIIGHDAKLHRELRKIYVEHYENCSGET